MITRRRLWVRRNGGNYGYHLHTNNLTGNAIVVKIGGSTLYCPLYSGTSVLNVRKNGANFYTGDVTPVVTTYWSYAYSPQPYQPDYYVYEVSMSLNVAINANVDLYFGTASDQRLITIPAGALSASTGGFRMASVSYFLLNTAGVRIRDVYWPYSGQWLQTDVPESLWGV